MAWMLRAALVVLALLFVAPVTQQAAAREAQAAWAHERSDLRVDPTLRFGVLPNGMRYVILRNLQPAGIASLRLRIGSGSMDESEAERGVAHFLEHMNFNGSQNVPEGEMVKLLQRAGLAFGPDTNAYTSFNETVYMLDLPKVDAATLQTGLFIMRETADRLTLAADAIEREKGVVLSEERLRDGPEFRSAKRQYGFLLKGQPLPSRWPIGERSTISAFTPELVRGFYARTYRPENAVLVIVGEVDVGATETRVRALFSDWSQTGAAAPEPDRGTVARRAPEAQVQVEAGLPASVSLNYLTAPDLAPDTIARRASDARRDVALAVVNRRLQRIARSAEAPFISARANVSEVERSAQVASIDVNVRPGRWREGLAAGEQELRRALRFGFSQAEVDREVAELRAAYDAAAAGAATRDTRNLAGEIVNAVGEDEVVVHPAIERDLFRTATDGLQARDVHEALGAAFQGQGPLIFVESPEAIQGGENAVMRAYRSSRARAVTRPQAEESATFAYGNFGPPGAVAERAHDAEFDFHRVRFANGVRLTIKKTSFEQNAVHVNVRLAGGYLGLRGAKPGTAILAPFALREAGLGKMTAEEIEEATAGRIVGLGVDVNDGDLSFGGSTQPQDLSLQLALLAAAVSDPGWRGQGLERLQASAENFLAQYGNAPGRVLARDGAAILRSGDMRWAFPDLAQVRSFSMDDLKAALGGMILESPLEVSIVGDVDVEAAIAEAAKTFGALAERRGATPAEGDRIRFPAAAAQPIRLTHEGRTDQSVAFIAWPAVDFSDARKARAVRLARMVLDNRLTEEFREKQGGTYSPDTGEELSQTFAGYGYVSASVEVPPADAPRFYETIDQLVAELREGRFTDDDLERARRPAIDRLKTSERGNGYWAAVLQDVQSNPRRLDLMRTRISDLAAITKAEVAEAARATFAADKAVRVLIVPKS